MSDSPVKFCMGTKPYTICVTFCEDNIPILLALSSGTSSKEHHFLCGTAYQILNKKLNPLKGYCFAGL